MLPVIQREVDSYCMIIIFYCCDRTCTLWYSNLTDTLSATFFVGCLWDQALSVTCLRSHWWLMWLRNRSCPLLCCSFEAWRLSLVTQCKRLIWIPPGVLCWPIFIRILSVFFFESYRITRRIECPIVSAGNYLPQSSIDRFANPENNTTINKISLYHALFPKELLYYITFLLFCKLGLYISEIIILAVCLLVIILKYAESVRCNSETFYMWLDSGHILVQLVRAEVRRRYFRTGLFLVIIRNVISPKTAVLFNKSLLKTMKLVVVNLYCKFFTYILI